VDDEYIGQLEGDFTELIADPICFDTANKQHAIANLYARLK
jgi:hypothetical protein